MTFCIILIVVLLIAALIGTFKFLLPEKRAAYLSPAMAKVRDFLMMKHLYLEKILRTLYIIGTVITVVLCIAGGILTPFMLPLNFGQKLLGLLLGIIAGALLCVILLFFNRIFYESIMLSVMLTDAAKKINGKLGGEARPQEEPRRRLPPPSAPRLVTCRYCGARFDPRRSYCPNCDERY